MSLFIIVMVGVGFYAGIQATVPDIITVADRYYAGQHMMDFKIVSTLGLTEGDVNALKTLNKVKGAVPSYSLDVLDQDRTIRVHSIEESVNTLRLITGRMPQDQGECIADSKSYNIGDVVTIGGGAGDKLKNTQFTVTGTAESVLYLKDDYGSTTVGDGKLSSFIFVGKDNFILEAYTEIYVTAMETQGTAAYSKDYDAAVAQLKEELLKVKPLRENARYQEIYHKAETEIAENETKLNGEREKGEKELADAKSELDKNMQKLQSGKKELTQQETALQESIQKQTEEFEAARAQIADGWQEVNAALTQSGLEKGQLNTKIAELNIAVETMKAQLSQLSAGSPEYLRLSETIGQYSVQYEGLLKLSQSMDTLTAQEAELDEGIEKFQSEMIKAERGIEEGKNEIAKNEKKIDDAYQTYNENLTKFQVEISEAAAKLQDAREELLSLEQPEWHIFDRDAAVGYSELKSSIDVVASVAAVFPIFFILIVMLMTSNAMARMIAEERSELGTLISIGYKDHSIVSTYLFYVLSASGLGAVTGFFVGCRVIPPLIYLNFRFLLLPFEVQYNMLTLLLILAVTLTLMTAVTVVACSVELRQKPASLMRPVPPKKGQTILLEKIGPVWKRLSFTWKVTMRNMIRYKKRAFMTIVGVAGCTAFLLVGFGLKDSMDGVAEKQYGEIFRYGSMMILKDETQTLDGKLESLLAGEGIEQPLLIRQAAFKCGTGSQPLDAFLIVPENEAGFYDYYNLKRTADDGKIELSAAGVIITQKISDVFHADKGDTITVKDADNNTYDLMVSDVAENYTSNYIYMNSELYGKVFGKPASYNTVVADYFANEKMTAARLIESGLVFNVLLTGDAVQKVLDSNESLNGVIVLIVAVASLLAVVVLYNLTSINISERTREIATLKVLGFHDGETNGYIYREALILTLISIGVGWVLGFFLHRFVLGAIEGTSLMLFKKIKWFSFILSCLLTLIFSVIMQVVTYFKLRTINMIESLKSVE